ncbi:MAG: 13E12 repeat family protein, partial [Actinobacteria bacterium]|nr:13E12 repeat family protein [Actinomycetota bacterium]
MFEELAAAVEELEVPPAGEPLREVLDISDRLTAKTALALGTFDAAEGYEVDGATSTTAWLRHHGGQSSRAAARLACLARRLQRLPVTATAWAEGALSVGQVEAIVANVAPRLVELFAEHEGEVVPALVELSVPDTAVAMAHWARCAEAIDEGPEPDQRRRSAHASRTLDGRVELDASLDPEGGEVVLTALRLASTRNVEGEPRRTPAERQGDALVDVCRFFLDHQASVPGRRHRPHVNVVIDLEALLGGGPGTVLGGPV